MNVCQPSPGTSRLLWALGVNGEGSSHVTFAFIHYLLTRSNSQGEFVTVVYSARSKLDTHISEFLSKAQLYNSSPAVKLIRMPKACRWYIIHFLLKFWLNPSHFFSSVVVLDDFPFRLSTRQVLYFHQPNLIHSNKLIWKIKRFAFRSLLSPALTVYFQTRQIAQAFYSEFGDYQSLCFLHSLE
jgi:hypothetical protein